MLTNRIIFMRLMALLRSINPPVPLPPELEPFLWENMDEEPVSRVGRTLEWEGEKPCKAYYVVGGFMLVYSFDATGGKHTFRIYRKNTIVALDSFLEQTASEYMIWACPGAVVWSIDRRHMPALQAMEGMELMVEKTASKFMGAKERLRSGFLALTDEERVLTFYQTREFERLLPPRCSAILDEDLADYLDMNLSAFRRARRKLKREKRLKH